MVNNKVLIIKICSRSLIRKACQGYYLYMEKRLILNVCQTFTCSYCRDHGGGPGGREGRWPMATHKQEAQTDTTDPADERGEGGPLKVDGCEALTENVRLIFRLYSQKTSMK